MVKRHMKCLRLLYASSRQPSCIFFWRKPDTPITVCSRLAGFDCLRRNFRSFTVVLRTVECTWYITHSEYHPLEMTFRCAEETSSGKWIHRIVRCLARVIRVIRTTVVIRTNCELVIRTALSATCIDSHPSFVLYECMHRNFLPPIIRTA